MEACKIQVPLKKMEGGGGGGGRTDHDLMWGVHMWFG